MLTRNKMNFYKFSTDSRPELVAFYKAIKKSSRYQREQKDVWEKLLPNDNVLLKELENILSTEKTVDVDLTIDTPSVTDDELIIEDDNNLPEVKLNTTSIVDLVDSIKENLKNDNCVSDDVIAKLISDCTEDNGKNIFEMFLDCLDMEPLCNLGNSIILAKCLEQTTVPLFFIQCILIPKLFSEHNKQIEILFPRFLNNYLYITCREFSKHFQEINSCARNIQHNFRSISNQQKQQLLRDFVLNSTKLEQQHFSIVEILITPELDVETLGKLIDLLVIIASAHTSDKLFGKLILNIITCSGRNALIFEHQLKDIIAAHRSVWKGKLQATLETCLEDNFSMSQSLRY